MIRMVRGVLLLVAAACPAAEWTVISEVPILGVPVEILAQDDGSYRLTFRDFDDSGYFLRGVFVDGDGVETDSSMILPQDAGGWEPLMPTEEDFLSMELPEGVVRIDGGGDTLWTCVLDTIPGYEGTGVLLRPSASGGCWAVFGPVSGDDAWRVFRLSSSGGVEASGSFRVLGGPVNAMHDIEETPDGGLLLAGVTDSLGMRLYSVLVRLDDECLEEWRVLDPVRFHACGDIVVTASDGSILLAGYTGLERSDGWFMPPEDMDVFLNRLAPDGTSSGMSILHLPGQNAPLLMTLLDGGGAVLLVSSFEENSSFPGVYSLVLCSPE